MLGNAGIDEKQEIEIAEVDGFLLDDESVRQNYLKIITQEQLH